MSLMPTRTCTRYMSPTRLGQATRSSSLSPVPPRRWKSADTKHSVRSHRMWKGPELPPGVQSYREILGITSLRANTFSSHKNEQDGNLAAVSVAKRGKGQYLDAQSVLKVLASLHIDIPGLVGGFLKSEPKLKRMESQDDSCLKSETISASKSGREQTVTMPKPKSNQYWSEDVKDIEREQHNFEDAMLNAHESVKTYFLDMSSKDDPAVVPGTRSGSTVPNAQGSTETQSSNSLVDQLKQYIPSAPFSVLPGTKSPTKEEEIQKKLEILRKQSEAKYSTERRTRALVMSLKRAKTDESKLSRLQDFCDHLVQNPGSKALAAKELVIPVLLKMKTRSQDQAIKESAHQALIMVGYTFPVKDRGIKILSIDGGGTRGLMAIQLLKEIEKLTGKPVRETFDYICGVSTGALLATMISIRNVPLKDCEELYKQFSKDMFSRSRWVGASKLVTSHAYYDHAIWEKILQETIGVSSFIDSAKDMSCPKVSLVSTLMNRQIVENYLFRNYTYTEGTSSHYPGSYHHKLWEGIRASSAAPTYYQEFKLGDFIHQDGGVLANNPTAIAIHEARLLWPDIPIQSVISLGTGRYRPTGDPEPTVSLRDKIDKMVQSATDTEAVHTMLQDLLPPSTYFRFNPYMSENFTLNEIREEKWDQMKTVTDLYIRKNELKLQSAAQILGFPKLPQHKIRDWAKVILDERVKI